MNALLVSFALSALLASTSIAAQSSSDHESHHADPKATAATAPMSDGEVRKVDRGAGKVTIKHGPLQNLDMPLGKYRLHAGSISSESVINGRIMALSSQLAGLSALRRRTGRADLRFAGVDVELVEPHHHPVQHLPDLDRQIARPLQRDAVLRDVDQRPAPGGQKHLAAQR